MSLQLTKLENRFQRLGSYPYEQCVRDLGTLVDRLNALEGEITDQVAQELADLAASIAAGLAGTLADYLTTADAAATYETQSHAAATFETQTHASSTYVTNSALASTLSAYVTIAGLSLTLASYVTTSYLTTNYTTTAALTTLLAAKQAAATVLTNLSAISWVAGDLITFSGANAPARIAKGSKRQMLMMDDSGGLPIWNSPAWVNEANWQTAGWQTLNGVQGITNGGYNSIRGMFVGGSGGGVGLSVIGVSTPGYYFCKFRMYIASGQAGRIHIYKAPGPVEVAFCQFASLGDSNVWQMHGIVGCDVGAYFYIQYDGAYNIYHAQNHTAFTAHWIAPL